MKKEPIIKLKKKKIKSYFHITFLFVIQRIKFKHFEKFVRK